MTAVDWDTTDDVTAMLEAIRGRASDRKYLLFACGCCRAAEGHLPGVRFLADRFEKQSRQPLSAEEKWSMLSVVGSALQGDIGPLAGRFLSGNANDSWRLANNVGSLIRFMTPSATTDRLSSLPDPDELHQHILASMPRRSIEQAGILRELVANPFVDWTFDPAWRTETVLGIASAIESLSAWDRFPILADALQDAGCEQAAILEHCRDFGIAHRHGCWVLDSVLGTE